MNYGRLNYELWPPIYGECRVWIGSNDHPAGGCTYQGVCVQRDRTTPCICTILIGYNQGQKTSQLLSLSHLYRRETRRTIDEMHADCPYT